MKSKVYMAKKFLLHEPEDGFTSDSTLCIDISLDNMSHLYQTKVLERRVIDDLRSVSLNNAIKTREFHRPQGLGATGSPILVWIYDFYQNHSMYFALIAKIPGLLKLLKMVVHGAVNAYYRIRNKKFEFTKQRYGEPFMKVILVWDVECRSHDAYTNNYALKCSYVESLYVMRQFEDRIRELLPDLRFSFFVKYKSKETGAKLAILGLDMDGTEKRVLGKLGRFKDTDRSFRVEVIPKTFFGIKRLKYEKNFVDLADAFGFD